MAIDVLRCACGCLRWQLVFVAGAKVRTDLFTIPFSKGLNLICIHSKKYIEDDPSTKAAKTQENLMAMKVRGQLFRSYV
jgi:glycerol-3-phosphate O-acyltransferase